MPKTAANAKVNHAQRIAAKPVAARARVRKHPPVLESTLKPTKVSGQAIERAVRAVVAHP